MARPEGYRKAKRLIELADKFHLPVLSFVNTSGAYPGMDSEEHGQSQAIAVCIQACARARVPIISVVIGEGGSGGAVAIATANRVLMLEHAFYSVVSPEGCASILWKTAAAKEAAAEAQKLTAQDLFQLGVIDRVIQSPLEALIATKMPRSGLFWRRWKRNWRPYWRKRLISKRNVKSSSCGWELPNGAAFARESALLLGQATQSFVRSLSRRRVGTTSA